MFFGGDVRNIYENNTTKQLFCKDFVKRLMNAFRIYLVKVNLMELSLPR
jgi:hypothetical protein